MFDRLSSLSESALAKISSAKTSEELESLRISYLGKKSELKALLKKLGVLPAEEKPRFGAAVNDAVKKIESKLLMRRQELLSSAASVKKIIGGVDYTRPGFIQKPGLPHPLISTIEKIQKIFLRLGYGIAEGPDIEDDQHNFSDLNFPTDHPARDAQDTFFIEPIHADNPLLLRTHTSPLQIRVMSCLNPPFAVIVPGRTYRSDAPDATHSPIFHQVEGLVVDENITMSDLKGTLSFFAKELFGPDFKIRFRPSFFPFTEPSAEVDVSCVSCSGKGKISSDCRVCKGTGWLEILGAGMVDPNVFESACRRRGDRVYDPEKVSGFAFGMGVERIAMLTHNIDDMRNFFENDSRFLEMLAS